MRISSLLTLLFLCIALTSIYAQQRGNASFYSSRMHGRHTSDGGKYHTDSLTCAHRTYPFGTLLKVRNPKNDKQVIVKVTDRGPHRKRLLIDLSYSAAKELDIVRAGVAQVEITRMDSVPAKQFILPSESVLAQVSGKTNSNK